MALDASGSLGTLFVELTANTANLVKGMNEGKEAVKKGAEGIMSVLESAKGMVEGFIAAFAIEKIAEWSLGIMESIDHLKKFSQEVDINVTKLGALKFAADKADVGDAFEMGMRKFAEASRQAQVQGSAMELLFKKLGVNPFGPLDEGLMRVSDDFAGWANGANKMGMAAELFGVRNQRFVNFVNEGSAGLKAQIELYGQMIGPEGLDGAAKSAEEFNDAMKDLKALATGVFIELSKELIPMLTDWLHAMRDNHAVIHDVGALINSVLVPSFKLASASLELLVIGFTKGSTFAMQFATALAPGVVALGKLALYAGKQMAPEAGGLIKSLSDDADKIKENLEKLSKDLDTALAKTMTSHAEVIKHGADKMKEGTKEAADNVAALNALFEQLKKMDEGFGATKLGIQKDIFSAKGLDASAQFTGYQQEVAVAQKQIDDLKKLGAIKELMTKEQLQKQTDLMKLYAEKQHALLVAQNQLVLDSMQKMSDDFVTIAEGLNGKQSELYKVAFAASKAFAIATATVKIMQGIASAAGAPWPLNLFAMAQVVAATASIVSSIQSVKLEFGGAKALGGPVSPDKAFLVGERGPEMFVPGSAGNIIPNNQLTGGNVRVNIQNYTDAQPQVVEKNDGDERVIEIVMRRVKNEVGSDIKNGNGPISTALKSTFGLRRGQTQ
jgi:hypothetical protein